MPVADNPLGLILAPQKDWLDLAFHQVHFALRIPLNVVSFHSLATIAQDFITQAKITFSFVESRRQVNLAAGFPIGPLRVQGPLTNRLREAGLSPRLLIKQHKERGSTGCHYSPQLLVGLVMWHRMAARELRASKEEGRLFRCLLYNGGGHNWTECPPPLPFHLLPLGYKALQQHAQGKEYKNLGQLVEDINDAQITIKDGEQLIQIYVQGSATIRNKTTNGRRRFGEHWADLVVGNTSVDDVGIVPKTVKATLEPDPEVMALLASEEGALVRNNEDDMDVETDLYAGIAESTAVLVPAKRVATQGIGQKRVKS